MYKVPIHVLVLGASVGCAAVDPDGGMEVHITAPGDGASLSGVVTVSAQVALADYPTTLRFDLPDGTSAVAAGPPFATTWNSATVRDGAGYTIRATATDVYGDSASTSIAVAVANAAAPCTGDTFDAQALPLGIPDDGVTGLRSKIHIAGDGRIAELRLSMSITHEFPEDLYVRLVAPTGAELVISDPDAPVLRVNDRLLTAFSGQPVAGEWALVLEDLEPGGKGKLNAWSLAVVGDCRSRLD
jgi:hypothetical protein